jgi:hypothetical protein
MDETLAVEPFGFFTRDSLRAGWYLVWRQLVRVVPVAVGALLIGFGLGRLGLSVLGGVVSGLGVLAAAVWAIVLVPRLASQWAEGHYGYPLTGQGRVWWAIFWRSSVASLVASVVLTPPTMVAASLSIAFQDSALGGLGKLMMALLVVVNGVVAVVTTGWAMSKVASTQLSGLPMTSLPFEPAEISSEPSALAELEHADEMVTPSPVTMPEAVAMPVVAHTPTAVATAPPAAPIAVAAAAPRAVVTEGKRQCPKCGLHETERGTVIGWYCTICGWRESRR